MSPIQRCFSNLVCQPLSATVIDMHRVLLMTLISGHVARLDPGVPAHDALRLMMDTYESRKASWRRPPGRPRNVWLIKIQEDANNLLLSTLWRSEITRGHGATQRSLGLRDDDCDGDDDDDDEG